MKDIKITNQHIRRELLWLLIAFVIANFMNVYAISAYETSWSEMFSQLGYIIILSFVLYVVLWILRGIFRLVKGIFRKSAG